MTDVASLEIRADSRSVRTATKDLGGMAVASQGATKSLALLRNSLALIVTAKLIGTLASTTAEFTQELANLSAITGATGEDLAFYAEQAKEIGATTSLSASQAVTAFKLIASAKPELLKSADALAQVTREAVTLAEATGIELPAAASALGSALNQFQIDASKADDVINILAASSKLGTAEVGSVTLALRNAGSAANALGLDLAETVAGIQALAASGRQGADAGTALRQVLLKLEKTADQTLMPSVVGLSDALGELESRNLTNTDLMKLFGEEAFTAATSLLAQKDIVADLNVELRGTSVATEQAAIRTDTLTKDVDMLASAWEGLLLEIGGTDIYRGVIQGLTEDIRGLTTALDIIGDSSNTTDDRMSALLLSVVRLSEAFPPLHAALRLYLTADSDPYWSKFTTGADGAGAAIQTAHDRLVAFNNLRNAGVDPFADDEPEKPFTMFPDAAEPFGVLRPGGDAGPPEDPFLAMFDDDYDELTEAAGRTMFDIGEAFRAWGENEEERHNLVLEHKATASSKFFDKEADELDELSIFADEAARNMQTAFADFLFDPFDEGLSGMLKSFGQTIQRMLAEQAAAGIMDMLGGFGGGKKSGKGGGGAGGIVSGIAGLFGFADGGSFEVGGSGGTDSQLVAFKASPNETVEVKTPAQQGKGGGSIGQIVMNFPGVRDKKTAEQAAGTMGRELTRVLGSAQRYS